MMPSRQIRPLFQSGHHFFGAVATGVAERGARTPTMRAMTTQGTPQNATSARQLPANSGSTSMPVSATGKTSPISRPLV